MNVIEVLSIRVETGCWFRWSIVGETTCSNRHGVESRWPSGGSCVSIDSVVQRQDWFWLHAEKPVSSIDKSYAVVCITGKCQELYWPRNTSWFFVWSVLYVGGAGNILFMVLPLCVSSRSHFLDGEPVDVAVGIKDENLELQQSLTACCGESFLFSD